MRILVCFLFVCIVATLLCNYWHIECFHVLMLWLALVALHVLQTLISFLVSFFISNNLILFSVNWFWIPPFLWEIFLWRLWSWSHYRLGNCVLVRTAIMVAVLKKQKHAFLWGLWSWSQSYCNHGRSLIKTLTWHFVRFFLWGLSSWS